MNYTLLLIESVVGIYGFYFQNDWMILAFCGLLLANVFFLKRFDKYMREVFGSENNFGYIFSTAFYHRLLIVTALIYLAWSDFWRFDITQFNNAALQ
jgi:hypothetical protein